MLGGLVLEYCNQLRQKGLYRKRCVVPERGLNFSSNDYLSLTHDKRVKQAFQKGFTDYPSGSAGSMVICGYHAIHQTLEQTFAKALDCDDAVLFSSGYSANLAVMSLLSRLKAHLYLDKSMHASFYDGVQQNHVPYTRFLHNNATDLKKKLTLGSHAVVLTEGIFSMSGQIAALHELAALCHPTQAALIVDEAHSFGVIGQRGLGLVNHHQLTQKEVVLRIIPFGKALACQGAVVVGRGEWMDALLQAARSYIYSTGLSPALAYGVLETLQIVLDAEDRRKKLVQSVEYFNQCIKGSPLTWRHSVTPIQQLQLGCPKRALHYAEQLHKHGIFCLALREPTVTKKETGLRIILNYDHEQEDMDRLFLLLHSIMRL